MANREEQACVNTDRELYREPDNGNGSYYSDSIHVTKDGGIGINVGGTVFVKPLREWHRLATPKGTKTKEEQIATIIRRIKADNESVGDEPRPYRRGLK